MNCHLLIVKSMNYQYKSFVTTSFISDTLLEKKTTFFVTYIRRVFHDKISVKGHIYSKSKIFVSDFIDN